ncbi:MAG: LytTR family DNA-binding domain-containing protein [Bacteroidia bacterium]|nr:LytTR family DNA-binding domain-containing protein [Bacteroidia bacterium]
MLLQAIAIDDEPAALKVIESHASKIPFLNLKETFLHPTDGLAYLQKNQVDLVFLDVQMPDLMGTELAELLRSLDIQLVFITAYADYAVKGFQLQALDYLLKPVPLTRFLEACNRALQGRQKRLKQSPSLFIKDGYDWVRIELEKVLYIRSDTNLLFFHQEGKTVSTRMTISKALELLPQGAFVRVHKSYIVAISAIKKIERHQLTVGNEQIPMASSYKEHLQRLLLP